MGKHRAIPAAEMYAEVGDLRPRCECHGELKVWKAHTIPILGGYWTCVVKQRESSRLHKLANPEKIRAANARRIGVFGVRIIVPEGFQETARQMRDQRKEEQR